MGGGGGGRRRRTGCAPINVERESSKIDMRESERERGDEYL